MPILPGKQHFHNVISKGYENSLFFTEQRSSLIDPNARKIHHDHLLDRTACNASYDHVQDFRNLSLVDEDKIPYHKVVESSSDVTGRDLRRKGDEGNTVTSAPVANIRVMIPDRPCFVFIFDY
jgi:uncharacterized protein (UPF0248 family)